MKAIVVGAGLAGLSAAYELSKAGWEVQVLEADGRVGGRVETVRKNGYLFDSGAIGTGTVYADYMRLLDELDLKDSMALSSTVSSIYRDGKVHEIDSAKPITGLTTRVFSWGSKLKLGKLGLDVFKVKNDINIRDVAGAHQYDTESAYEYASRRLNPELTDNLIVPLHRTLNLSRADRISKLELFNALTGLFSTTMFTLIGGSARLAEKLAEHAAVSLGSTVTAVRKTSNGVEVDYQNADGEQSISADACVIATTLPVATKIYGPATDDLAPLSNKLRYNRSVVVTLGFAKPTTTNAMMVMLPVAESEEHALLFLEHNKGPDRAPDGHSLITVFFDDVALDSTLAKDDEQIAQDTAQFVEKVLPELAGSLDMSHVRHWGDHGLTNPDVGLFKLMNEVNEKLDAADPVQYAGDYFSTAGQNTAIVYGKRAADNLIAAHPR